MRLLLVLALLLGGGCSKSSDPPSDPPSTAATVTVEHDRVLIENTPVPDRGGAINRSAIEMALHERTGPISMAIAPDAPYGRLLEVTDILFGLGLDAELDVGRGGPQLAARPRAATGLVADTPILVLSVSTTAIYLGAEEVTRLADVPPGDDIPALAATIGRRPERSAHLALQADNAVPGALIVRVIGTARRAGVANVTFPLRISEPARQPMKRGPTAP